MKANLNHFQKKGYKTKIWHVLLASTCGLAVFTALLCLAAVLLTQVDVPMSLLVPITMIIICSGVAVCAMVFAMLEKKRGLIYGALIGLCAFMLLWLISIINGSNMLTQLAAIKAFSVICCGALGGYIGMLKAEKHRKRAR